MKQLILLLSVCLIVGCEEGSNNTNLLGNEPGVNSPSWDYTDAEKAACDGAGFNSAGHANGMKYSDGTIEVSTYRDCTLKLNYCNAEFEFKVEQVMSGNYFTGWYDIDLLTTSTDTEESCPTLGQEFLGCRIRATGGASGISSWQLDFECFENTYSLTGDSYL